MVDGNIMCSGANRVTVMGLGDFVAVGIDIEGDADVRICTS